MNNWNEYKLGDVTTKIGSGATPTGGSLAYLDEGISLVRSQNVLDLKFSKDGLAFISDDQARRLQNVTVEENDVLLNITGDSVARVCKMEKRYLPARVNQHVSIIRANEKLLDSNYLLYNLISLKPELLSISEIGATRRAITKGMIENLPITLPPLPTQKAIATILSRLDAKIDLLHRQNQTLEQLAETLFRKWFVEDAKEDWEMGSFSKWILETVGGEWGKENLEHEFNKAVNCIRGTDIADLITGLPLKTPIRFVKEKKFENIQPKEGDLIIEISGGTDNQSTGRVCYINDDVQDLFDYPIVFSNFCRMIRIKRKDYSFFLYCYLQFLYNQGEFFNLENGSSGIKNLDYKALLNEMEFKMPGENEVISFNKKIKPLFKKQNQNKKQIKTLTQLRDSLLPQLMSGAVKIKA